MSGSNLRSSSLVNAEVCEPTLDPIGSSVFSCAEIRTHEQGALGLLREDEMKPRCSGVVFATPVECPEVGLAALR
ncbi:hypothetical protein RHGRI_029408 [Rhododendron griersonianum]|uniref:Uncharacterized protein n=1 Tax=Rhododendron griersonianum TaxID=479676 RepID=A0AAV6IMR7_9ERIC|nr:hypothetical protein RHGRI_029408 [Rhododendron griersonianum]